MRPIGHYADVLFRFQGPAKKLPDSLPDVREKITGFAQHIDRYNLAPLHFSVQNSLFQP